MSSISPSRTPKLVTPRYGSKTSKLFELQTNSSFLQRQSSERGVRLRGKMRSFYQLPTSTTNAILHNGIIGINNMQKTPSSATFAKLTSITPNASSGVMYCLPQQKSLTTFRSARCNGISTEASSSTAKRKESDDQRIKNTTQFKVNESTRKLNKPALNCPRKATPGAGNITIMNARRRVKIPAELAVYNRLLHTLESNKTKDKMSEVTRSKNKCNTSQVLREYNGYSKILKPRRLYTEPAPVASDESEEITERSFVKKDPSNSFMKGQMNNRKPGLNKSNLNQKTKIVKEGSLNHRKTISDISKQLFFLNRKNRDLIHNSTKQSHGLEDCTSITSRFDVGRILGKGLFADVRKVTVVGSNDFKVMKIYDKYKLIDSKRSIQVMVSLIK